MGKHITHIFERFLAQNPPITGQWGNFTVKNATLFFYIYFLHSFLLFFIKKICFYHFHLFF